MTLDELRQRDGRIAALEAIPAAGRTIPQQRELGRLLYNRDQHWRRYHAQLARQRQRTRDLETYGRQTGLLELPA